MDYRIYFYSQEDATLCVEYGNETAAGTALCPAGDGQAHTVEADEPSRPTTREDWMLLAAKEAILPGLKGYDHVEFGHPEHIKTDRYGRTYAEVVVRAGRENAADVLTRYAIGFLDVTDAAPCRVIPKALFILPLVVIGAQRQVAKKLMRFDVPW